MHTINPSTLARLPQRIVVAAAATFMLPVAAFAAGSGIPWEAPLQQLLDSVQGPVAKIVSDLISIITGLALASGDTSGGFPKHSAERRVGKESYRSCSTPR